MKKKIIIGILTLIVVIGITSFSYGYLIERRESGNQDLALSNFGLIIEEDMVSVTINDAYPMSDEEGTSQEETNFSIKNTSTVSSRYEVSLKDKEVVSTLQNESVRYQLKRTRSTTNEEETLEIKNLKSDGIIDEGIIDGNESISYKLVIWIDYDFNTSEKGLVFSKIISLKGIQQGNLDESGANPPEMLENMIPVYYDATSDTEGVWRKADPTNQTLKYKWYDYNDFMWANAVTVKEGEKRLADSVGNVIDNSYTNSVLENGNLYLDGVDDFYRLGPLNIENTVTLVARFKTLQKNTTSVHIISNTESAGLSVSISANSKLFFQVYINGGYRTALSNYDVVPNTWYTVVATYDGNDLKLYANGNLIATFNYSGTVTNSKAELIIGGDPGVAYFPTSISLNMEFNKALVYNVALSDTDVSTYFQGEITDYPKDNLIYDTKKFELYNYKALYKLEDNGNLTLNGKDNYINLKYNEYDFKDKVSLVARFKVNEISNDISYIIANTESAGFYLGYTKNYFSFRVDVNKVYQTISVNTTLKENTWYTLVGTYDGNDVKLYLKQEDLLTTVHAVGSITPSISPILLGGDPAGKVGYPAAGLPNITISDIYIYTDALTDAEISEYFTDEITDYPKDNLLIAYDEFSLKDNRETYEQAKPGVEIPMDEITSMWVWIPRYKYTIFNGNYETAVEQMIDVKFEHGIETTGTVKCQDKILTDDNSASSEECTDEANKGIKNGVSTYTHPAFTFGEEELTGLWFSKFDMSTDDNECLTNQSTNCNKIGMDIYIKPNQVSLRYINISNIFVNARNMEAYGNIHGFPQSSEAIDISTFSNFNGEITNDSNKYDIHIMKNMEWGTVAYLTMSKYGKYGNSLYEGEYKEVYKNNYQEINNNIYTLKTGYSGKIPTGNVGTNGVLYNNLTIETKGQGYLGAGASTTGTVYGTYDMAGFPKFVMANMISSDGNFLKYGWQGSSLIEKYFDKYSFNITNGTEASMKRGKLGDATREVQKQFNIVNSRWYNGTAYLQHDSKNGVMGTWLGRFNSDHSQASMFATAQLSGGPSNSLSSRPVLTISREFGWLDS